MTLYALHGLVIDSEPELDAWGLEDRGGAPDATVTCGPRRTVPGVPPGGTLIAHADDEQSGERQLSICTNGHGYVLRYHRHCEVSVSPDLRKANLALGDETPDDMAGIISAGGIVGFLVTIRGALSQETPTGRGESHETAIQGGCTAHGKAIQSGVALHASAVLTGGRATAIVGGAGSGKSTLGALLCGAGSSLLSDDALRVDPTPNGAVCFAGTRSVRLRSGVAGCTGLFPDAPTSVTSDGRTRVMLSRQRGDPLGPVELAAIVVPIGYSSNEKARVGRRHLTRLSSYDALTALLPHNRTPNLVHPLAMAHHLRVCAFLARQVPVYALELPPFYWESDCFGAEILEEIEHFRSGA